MDNITKGDPIKADWANALTNALNAVTHGKTSMRGGGGQNVSIAPYQRGSRPLAFDLVEITDDAESSLSGTISGGLLFHSYKEDQGDSGNPEEKKVLLKTEKIKIEELAGSFKAGEKVWVKVSYDSETWKAESAILENGSEVPAPEDGTAYFVVGEFEEHDKSIIYKHYGVSCIKWDALKWEFKEYKLKTDPKCALELKKSEEENELTLNIESSSEEESVDADSNLKVWLVQKKGKGADGAEEGPVKLGVRIKDERPDYTGAEPIEITNRTIALKFDKEVHSTENGIKYGLKLDGDNQLSINLEAGTSPEPVPGEEYSAENPLFIDNKVIRMYVNTEVHSAKNGIKYGLKINGEHLDINIDADTQEEGENLSFRKPLRKNGIYVVLDCDTEEKALADGTKINLNMNSGGQLCLDVNTPEGGGGGTGGVLISDAWASLVCNTDHALRIRKDQEGYLYIQHGLWDKLLSEYVPQD